MNLVGLENLACVKKQMCPYFAAFYICIWVQPEGLDGSKAEKFHTGVKAVCNKFYC